MAEAVVPASPPEEVAVSEPENEAGPASTAEPPEVVPTRAKKPRKPRPPKLVTKLAAVSETAPTAQEAPLPLEFWAGLMQTQKVIMARRKSDHYNSFRIV